MRDSRKFCRPKITKNPKIGDVYIKLKCGETAPISAEEYNKVKEFFKLDSVVGSSPSIGGNLIVKSKLLDVLTVISPEDFDPEIFELKGVVGEKSLAEIGDVLVHNTILNIDSILSFNDWVNANDSWELTGLYGIETFEEEDTVGGEYVIMANGTTLIIKPEDYSKVSNNWEKVDEIPTPVPEHEYVEIGGIKWATMNIGASQPSDYGLYFAWGDTQGYTAEQVGSGSGQKYFGWADYKYGDGTSSPGATGMSKYNSTDGLTTLEAVDDAAVANWGGSWRTPTTAEFQALGAAVNTAWTADYQGSGVSGLVLTDKTDSSKTLFFPAAGYCNDGSVEGVGNYGIYWSSSLYTDRRQSAYGLSFNSYGAYWGNDNSRYYGFAVRPVFDE